VVARTTAKQKLPARLEHSSAGRVRVRVPKENRTERGMEALRHDLSSHPAVAAVEVNRQTGSVLVHGEDGPALTMAVGELLDVVEKAGPEGEGEVGVETAVGFIKAADRRLSQLTGRRVSLRWVVPAAFVGLGLRALAVEGLSVGTLPWFVLVYYGVDSFLKLYPEHAPAAKPAAGGS
jgi:hypothetical protein